MPTKLVNCNRGKAVLVRVYAEKHGKRRSSSSIQEHHRHHHQHVHYHIHQTFRQEAHTSAASKGYDRRAGLLNYSQQLRASARGTSSASSSTPFLSMSTDNNIQPAPTKMISLKKKSKDTRKPTCFGNWKLLIPRFLRSWWNAPKTKKKERRGRNFFSNVYSIKWKRARV